MTAKLNRCYWQAASAGTGDFVYSETVAGYLSPSNADAVDGETYAQIAEVGSPPTEWEISIGIYDAGSGTVARTAVIESSNGGAKTDFSDPPRVRMGVPLAADFGGWEVLERGEVSSPVETIEIVLPAGYSFFRLTGASFEFSGSNLTFAISDDGGATYYNSGEYRFAFVAGAAGGAQGDGFQDDLGYLHANSASKVALLTTMISPGGATEDFALATQCNYTSDPTVDCSAVQVTVSARANRLLLLPYGNGDVPPTSADTITNGRWVLEGL